MKNTFFAFLLLISFSLNAQQFAGKISIGIGDFTQDATTTGLDTYTGNFSSFTTPYSYLATQISIGDILVTPSVTSNECRKYRVTAINTAGINITVRELANYNAVPFGTQCLIATPLKGLLPSIPALSSYITEEVAACVTFYNNEIIDSLTSDVIRGSTTLPTVGQWDDIYIDTTSANLYYVNGGAWTLFAGGSGSNVTGLSFDGTTVTLTQGAGGNQTVIMVKGTYADDDAAGTGGVAVGEWYILSSANEYGAPAGMIRQRQ